MPSPSPASSARPSRRDIARFQARDPFERKAGALFSRAKRLHGGTPNGWVSGRQLAALLAACDWTCHYCGARLAESEVTFDHLEPLSRPGGVHAIWNLTVACHHDNCAKGDLTADEYRAVLAAKQAQKEPTDAPEP